ncbi:MAG: mannose-1-phosphate guanylyltransferase/mannose-6-phosphate isomerase [Azospirillum sp.]|nr:mannose-1-phosphate guanylyltransferase/mannose-6-phosphate isomerase [Azospirillum sp.]
MGRHSSSGQQKIHPAILSGGAGVRLWPMSREQFPKQVLNLTSDHSMIQETALRVLDPENFTSPLVVCNEEHRFVIAEQLRQIGCQPARIILEPVGRNTAAAVAVSALTIAAEDPDGLMLVLPADHLIRDRRGFHAAVAQAAAAARAGSLVTFGIVPTAPETGYGYIRRGAAMGRLDGTFQVAAFVEKPSREVAQTYIERGDHFWNSGMFLFPVAEVLAELERFEPAVVAACREALAGAVDDVDFLRLAAAPFAAAPTISIDYAVMERTERAVVVPADIGWTDVGSWSALWEIAAKDSGGNVQIGDVISTGSRNCYLRSEGALVAAVGLENIIVVATADAVMVADRDRVGEIKGMVQELKRLGRDEPISHLKVHRPWGFYQLLHHGDRFQVKRLTVNSGAKLSLQLHYHRAEHWTVVNGTALVTRNQETILLRENESMFIPLGTPHRLENPGRVPLNLIEVQSGAYLGEDDIVRLGDTYGRS